jgi:hypothetical protein
VRCSARKAAGGESEIGGLSGAPIPASQGASALLAPWRLKPLGSGETVSPPHEDVLKRIAAIC